MKKQIFISPLIAIAITAMLFASCKKDDNCNIKRPFKAKVDTWYRISPTGPQTVVVNGTTYIGFAYFPGGGSGNATGIGTSSFYFNQLVYAETPDAPPAGSVAAPVTDAISYAVTGAPLPLIQAGDFAGLSNADKKLHIPSKVCDDIVNAVFYDDKGNAIFTSAITGSGEAFPISKTRMGFNGRGIIVDGRGKFEHATGAFNYDGYFNTIDANDAEYNADGWIVY